MNRLATVALTALAPVSWGSTYAVATELLPPDRPLFTGVMRALPAGLLLTALSRTLPKGQWWWKSAVLGGLNIGAFFPLLFLSAYRLPGGVAAVLGSAGPLFVVGLAALLLGERASLRTVLAAITGALGVSMVVLTAEAELDLVGIVAGVISSASMAAGTVMTKRWGRPEGVGPLAMTGWQLTAGGLIIIPVAAFVEGAPPALDGKAFLGYGYMMLINTGIAYWLWFRGIGQLTATSVTLLGPLSPLTAAVIGWAALGQELSPVQLLGMAIAFGATVAGQLFAARAARASQPFSSTEETRRNVSIDLTDGEVRR
ncbi:MULTISPECIES: EamA family transporter [unclassified Streptomyces]|uniref:EamA family transporter n=1 Tax=unclassified Streptomyces TaxID=2593676 RepID=UPI001BE745E3|nr:MULTISPECIES: EamA family transporter [unclassified Streptomyces]MBT2404878.1 EamA family transporter [Streptomyces sp. ISL-21]MBT2456277.1 EamA family transporter [Streptomyces sp. ISL-86]